jgi:hypothetical protein
VSMLGGEGGQKEGYMCTSILYILEKISGRKTSLFFLKNTFWTSILMIRRNRYDDQAHSSFSFSFSSSCTQVQCWLILCCPTIFRMISSSCNWWQDLDSTDRQNSMPYHRATHIQVEIGNKTRFFSCYGNTTENSWN